MSELLPLEKKSRGYGRLGFFLVLAMAFIALTAGSAWAQETAAPGDKAKSTLFTVIFTNIDPIFIIIAILSVVGLTLIILGFLKNRGGTYMP